MEQPVIDTQKAVSDTYRPKAATNTNYLMKEYPLSGKTRISIIWPNGEKVCCIKCSEWVESG